MGTKKHEIKKVVIDKTSLRIEIDGEIYTFDLHKVSRRLLHATASERSQFKISPSGYGIHWPAIDEDISIEGLLAIKQTAFLRKR